MIQHTGIHHLALATRGMDATIRFRRDLPGMRLVAGPGRTGSRQHAFEVSGHDMPAFFEWPEVLPPPGKGQGVSVGGPFAFDHVGRPNGGKRP